MQQIIKTGSVKRGWLGVKIRTVDAQLAKSMRLSRTSGVVIIGLLPKSPAAKAGMKVGDLVTYFNNQRMRTSRGFLNYIAQRKPGSTLMVLYIRNKQTFRLEVILGARPPQPIIDDRGRIPDRPASAIYP